MPTKRKSAGDRPRYDCSVKGFVQLPKGVTSSANYKKLTSDAKALIQDANSFFNGLNNGDLSLAFTSMEELGWSKRRLIRARQELEYYGFLEITRQGGSHRPTLYALGWINIQWCKGKHDAAPSQEPPMHYHVEKSLMERPKAKRTSSSQATVRPAQLCGLSEPKSEISGSAQNRGGSTVVPIRPQRGGSDD